jgi:hypothetical protein
MPKVINSGGLQFLFTFCYEISTNQSNLQIG